MRFWKALQGRGSNVLLVRFPNLILSEKLTRCFGGKYKGSMDCGCYCPAPAKLICIYWGRNKQGQERGSNPVNHLHSAVYNGASALLILIGAGGTNIESDLFTHMARDYRSFIRYEEKKYSVHQCFEKWKQAWLQHVPFQCDIKVQLN